MNRLDRRLKPGRWFFGFQYPQPIIVTQMVVYVDPHLVQIVPQASDADIYGIDPRSAQLVASFSDADPFGVDPRSSQIIS
jgi:hypothetical protein